MKTFKILGLLLTYPRESLYAASAEMGSALRREGLLPAACVRDVEAFLERQERRDLLACQEEYVETFDRGRAHCLHLFEHVHGESRERGQAMADLNAMYAAKGLRIHTRELPDFLPLFMEYLSLCEFDEARDLLGEAIDVIGVIGARLRERGSDYACVFAALERLSAAKADKGKVAEALGTAPDPQTPAELDEQWREAEAFGGDPAAECNACDAMPHAAKHIEKWLELPR